jgi:hypothetical protein
LGFEFFDESVKDIFRLKVPKGDEFSLNHWNDFELLNPSFFSSMYQFWAIKL